MVNANPNFPAMGWEVDFTGGPPYGVGDSRRSINARYRRLAVRDCQIDRGRNYELDQVQSGTATMTVTDPLELLNPDNVVSPFATGGNQMLPYRCFRCWAMWPNQPGSGNIINTNVNSGYDPSFESATVGSSNPGLWGPNGGTTTCVTSTTQHFVGSKSMLVAQSAAGAGFGAWNDFRTAPDLDYTFSCYVYPTSGQVQAQVTDANGTVHTSASATTLNAWTRLTVSWTAVDTLEHIVIYGTSAGTPTFYVDATQLEFGSNVTTFTTSGPTLYMVYNGYIERYPTVYDNAGRRANHSLQAVDALAILSRTEISQSYLATIQADRPQLYLPLSDTAPPGVFTVGGNGFLSTPSPSPTGSLDWAGDQFLDGTNALVVTQKNQNNPPAPGGLQQDTEWNITQGQFTLTTSAATIEVWVKYVSGMITPLQVGVITDGKTIQPDQQFLQFSTIYQGRLEAVIADNVSGTSLTGSSLPVAGTGFADSVWHYLAFTLYASGSNAFAITFDGQELDWGMTAISAIWGVNNIHFSASTGFGNPQAQMSVCNWAFYPRDIGIGQRVKHYQRGVGYINELSGARVSRLLGQYWAGGTSVAGGFLAMAPDFSYSTRTMLDVLQEIQESERGLVYANAIGSVVFEDRSSRYTNQTALWTFGENATGGEYPYSDYAADHDPTYTFSQANLTRPANNNFAPMVNATTQAAIAQRILSQEMQCNTDFDLTQAGIFYLNRYAAPKTRITTLMLDPSANPALWPVVLSLEISQRVTVKRRSDNLTTNGDYYIEKISHKINSKSGSWQTTLQLSPVFVPTAWILGDATYGILGSTTVPIY